MSQLLKRGMVVDVNLEPTKGSETGKVRPCVVVTNDTYNQRIPVVQVVPIAEWSEKKARIVTNVILDPTKENGLTKKSVADCLQTRPIDRRHRLRRVRGQLGEDDLQKIGRAIKIVFALD